MGMAKLVFKDKASPKRKALAKKVVVENSNGKTKLKGTEKQIRAWMVEKASKALKPK